MKTPQRRTVIIRGRGQTELDNLLPIFCSIVEKSTPQPYSLFESEIIRELTAIIPGQTAKTIRNYYTEILGQLFSTYYVEKGQAEISPLALKLNSDGDQPFFFKVLASRIQFPNPSSKKHKYEEEVNDGLGVRPLVLVLQVMREVEKTKTRTTFIEIAYHILNSLDAQRGTLSPKQICDRILRARTTKFIYPSFEGSFARQHIKESLNLLYLANLIRHDSTEYWLNPFENQAIDSICSLSASSALFRAKSSLESHQEFQNSWKKHLTRISDLEIQDLQTNVASLGSARPMRLVSGKPRRRATDIGRDGELLVIDIENHSLDKAFPGSSFEAIDLAHVRGIGYDIESLFHEGGAKHGQTHFIEVKSTLRVTKPELSKLSVKDNFTLTRSEKLAADIYKEQFSVFRVYIYTDGYSILKFNNLPNLANTSLLVLAPENWNVEYDPSKVVKHVPLMEGDL